MDKKQKITSKTAVKGLINGFVAYSILLLFIFISVIVLVNWIINNNESSINYDKLQYILPVFASFIIYFLVRGICKLSTFDLFKKCKIDKKDVNTVSEKMNVFFICCIIFSVVVIVTSLLFRFHTEEASINFYDEQNRSKFSDEFSDYLIDKSIEEYKIEKNKVLLQVIITETGLLLGIFSLIPSQKKLINEYNN